MKHAAAASRRLGLNAHATFSGTLAWPFYPWPQRPRGLVEAAFEALASRWRPILDELDRAGVDVCFELHPGEDLHDGVSFERFLEAVDHHPRANILFDPSHFVLQQLDYLAFVDMYHSRIKAFHVKDAEFRPNGKQGVYGGYSGWVEQQAASVPWAMARSTSRRSFSKMAQYDFAGWAVLEWECALKHSEDGAREGAVFIRDHIIRVAERAFDDFAGSGASREQMRGVLGTGDKR